MKIRVAQSIRREPVNIGRIDLRAITSEVGKAYVVEDDVNYIRRRLCEWRCAKSHDDEGQCDDGAREFSSPVHIVSLPVKVAVGIVTVRIFFL